MATIEELEKKLAGIEEIRKSGKLESASNGADVAHQLIFAEMDISMEILKLKRAEEEKRAAEAAAAEKSKQAEVDEKETAKKQEAQKELDNMISNLGINDYLKK